MLEYTTSAHSLVLSLHRWPTTVSFPTMLPVLTRNQDSGSRYVLPRPALSPLASFFPFLVIIVTLVILVGLVGN